MKENTAIKDFIAPFLDGYFPNDYKVTTYGADKSISSINMRFYKMDPSLTQQCMKADYSVVHNQSEISALVVGAKSKKTNSKSRMDVVEMTTYLIKDEL